MSAQTWTAPTAPAPYNNVETPVNLGGDYQGKIGDFGAYRMRAGFYCDASGLNCAPHSSLNGGGQIGVGQQWYNVRSSRLSELVTEIIQLDLSQ